MRDTILHLMLFWGPVIFRWVSEYFWLMQLISGEISCLRMLRRIDQLTLDPSINRYEVRGLIRRMNWVWQLPWILMGIGKMLGFTPTCWYYFFPQEAPGFVMFFYVAMFAEACFVAWWVIFAGGARRLQEVGAVMAAYRQRFRMRIFRARNYQLLPERTIKLGAAIMPFFILYMLHFLTTHNMLPSPRVHGSERIRQFLF